MTISVNDLFTPAPSGVGQNPPASGSWLDRLLQNAATLSLAVTSWLPGDVVRTIFAIVATTQAAQDTAISAMIQGGFLGPASSVTPDPANASTWTSTVWTPGWLDILADGAFNVQRIAATYATVALNLGNTSASTYGPFSPGTYHVAAGTKTYSNVATLSIPPGGVTGALFQADVAGSAGTAAPGTITQPVTSLIGVTCTNPLSAVGSNAESNAALVARARLKLQALSPNGPKGAYQYFALTAAQLLAAQTPAVTIVPITRVLVALDPTQGIVSTFVASAAGTVPGVAALAVTGATNASPIVVTTASAHGLSNGNTVTISGVLGSTAANGTWTISAASGSTLTLVGSTGNSTYISGGILEGGDLGEVDAILQANAVPNGVTATTVSATATTITIAYSAWVPAARVSTFAGIASTALAAYFATLPIGGLTDPSGAYTNVLPFDAVQSVIENAASYVQKVTLTLNGGTSDITLAPTAVASLGPITPVVHGT